MANHMQVIEHTSESYNEFLHRCETTPRSKYSEENGKNSSEENGEGFSGTKTIGEAFSLCRTGWSAGVKQLPIEANSYEGQGIKAIESYSGGALNVGAYLNNRPRCFTRFKTESSMNLPRLTIYARLTYSAGNELKKALKFSLSLVNLVNSLQATNDIELIGLMDSTVYDGIVINEVILKRYGEKVVLNNLAAALHPSFFRRIWFRSLETTSHKHGGYGRTTAAQVLTKAVLKNRQYKDKAIITPELGTLDKGTFNIDDCKEI